MERHELWLTTAAAIAIAVVVGVASMAVALWAGMPAAALVLLVGGLIAAVVLPAALMNPDLAVILLIVADLTRLSDISTDIVGVGVFQPLLVVAIASLALGLVRGRLHLRWSPFYLLAMALLAGTALSVVVAGASFDGVEALVELSKDLVYLAVVLVWVGSSRSLKLATGVLVVTMASLAGLSVIQEFAFGNSVDFFGLSNIETTQLGAVTLRHSGPESDANFWARSLVVVLPLAISWWVLAKERIVRWIAVGSVVAIGLGLYLTQSRGGLIAASVAVLIWLVMAGRPYIRWLLLAPVVVAVLLAIPGVGSRLVTLTDVAAVERGAGDPSLQGRVGAQRSGISMFLEHPILGVGFGEFRSTVPEYQRKLGIQAEVLDAHNLYLEIAAEGGAIGLMTWGLFFGFGLFVALRAWLVSGQSGSAKDRWTHLMATGVVAGLVAWLLASTFLHASNLRIIFLVLAIAVGLDLLSRENAAAYSTGSAHPGIGSNGDAARSPSANRGRKVFLRRLVVLTSLAAIVFGLSSWLILRAAPDRWVAERHVVMVTGEETDWRYVAYSYDLITRGLVGGTYAALLEEPAIAYQAAATLNWDTDALDSIEVSASYAPASQVITVRVVGDDPSHVEMVADGIVSQGSQFILGLEEPFIVDAVAPDSTGAQPDAMGDLWRFALIVVIGAVLAAGVWYGSRFRIPAAKPAPVLVPQTATALVTTGSPSAPVEQADAESPSALEDRTDRGATPFAADPPERRSTVRAPTAPDKAGIDVNRATLDQLQELPGVGPAIARRIITYRDTHGPFATVEELVNVSGISDARLDRMRSSIASP